MHWLVYKFEENGCKLINQRMHLLSYGVPICLYLFMYKTESTKVKIMLNIWHSQACLM